MIKSNAKIKRQSGIHHDNMEEIIKKEIVKSKIWKYSSVWFGS